MGLIFFLIKADRGRALKNPHENKKEFLCYSQFTKKGENKVLRKSKIFISYYYYQKS